MVRILLKLLNAGEHVQRYFYDVGGVWGSCIGRVDAGDYCCVRCCVRVGGCGY